MTGYHELRVFTFTAKELNVGSRGLGGILPDGWKPFSATYEEGILTVVCRKWHRRDR